MISLEETLVKLNLYAIYDTASGVYDGPFKARSDAEAVRYVLQLS